MDQYKTSFRVPGGQYEFHVGAFGLHGMSSLLMRYMHAIFGRPVLAFDDGGRGRQSPDRLHRPMLGQFVQVYMDDILIFSRTKADHLIHVRMVLETLRHHRLYAKASKCQIWTVVGRVPGARHFGTRGRYGSAQTLGHQHLGQAHLLL